jgi:hypothetical protein
MLQQLALAGIVLFAVVALPRRKSSEMASQIRSKEVGRAIIPVEVGRREAWPAPPYHMSP